MSQNTVRAVLVSLLSVTKYSQSCAGEFTECHMLTSFMINICVRGVNVQNILMGPCDKNHCIML